jgi:hypothetical protein
MSTSPSIDNRLSSQRAVVGSSAGVTMAAAAPVISDADPANQWHWFSSTLDKARKKGKTVSRLSILYSLLIILSFIITPPPPPPPIRAPIPFLSPSTVSVLSF